MEDQTEPLIPIDQSNIDASGSNGGKKKPLLLVVLILVAVVLVVGICVLMVQKKPNTTTTNQSTSKASPAAISITASGFVPASIEINVGSTVTWTNNDTNPHQVTTDPFPTNDGLPNFDSGVGLPANATYSFKFEKSGTFTYHDQLNPTTIKGTVVVK